MREPHPVVARDGGVEARVEAPRVNSEADVRGVCHVAREPAQNRHSVGHRLVDEGVEQGQAAHRVAELKPEAGGGRRG